MKSKKKKQMGRPRLTASEKLVQVQVNASVPRDIAKAWNQYWRSQATGDKSRYMRAFIEDFIKTHRPPVNPSWA